MRRRRRGPRARRAARAAPRSGGHGARELDLQPLDGDRPEVLERVDGDQAPAPQDRHAVGHALDLRQRVRGEEDGPALRDDLPEQRVEALLHQRVEPGDRLVEDQQLRLVHEGLDQPELLAVAGRELAHRAVQLRVEALRQRVAHAGDRPRRAARRGSRASPRRSAAGAARSRRAGSRRGAGSRGCRGGCRGRARRRSPTSAGSGPAAGASWSTSRRRWARGTRAPRRAGRSRSSPNRPLPPPKSFVSPLVRIASSPPTARSLRSAQDVCAQATRTRRATLGLATVNEALLRPSLQFMADTHTRASSLERRITVVAVALPFAGFIAAHRAAVGQRGHVAGPRDPRGDVRPRRLRRDDRLPPHAHPPRLRREAGGARDVRDPRLDVGAGRRDPLGRRPPPPPRVHRRGGRPALPAHARRRGLARRAHRPLALAHGLALRGPAHVRASASRPTSRRTR